MAENSLNHSKSTRLDVVTSLISQTEIMIRETVDHSIRNMQQVDFKRLFEDIYNIEIGIFEYINQGEDMTPQSREETKRTVSNSFISFLIQVSPEVVEYLKELNKKLQFQFNLFVGAYNADKLILKLNAEIQEDEDIMNYLKVLEINIFNGFRGEVEFNLNLPGLPYFILSSFLDKIKDKIWSLLRILPLNVFAPKTSTIIEQYLNRKLIEIANDKIQVFDQRLINLDVKLCLFKLLLMSNFPDISKSDPLKKNFFMNVKKYIVLFGIQDGREDIQKLVANQFCKPSDVGNEGNSEIGSQLIEAIEEFEIYLNIAAKSTEQDAPKIENMVSLIVFFLYLVFNNFVAYETSNDETAKISFNGNSIASAIEKVFLKNLLFALEKPIERSFAISVKNIHYLCERIVLRDLIKSYASRFLYDDYSKFKIEVAKEALVNCPLTSQSSIIVKEYKQLVGKELKFVIDSKKINPLKQTFSYVSEKLKLTDDSRLQVDISHFKLTPLDFIDTTSNICILIGGSLLGNIPDEEIWSKLFGMARRSVFDLYMFSWMPKNMIDFECSLLSLIPKNDFIYESKVFVDQLKQNQFKYLREQNSVRRYMNFSRLFGKVLAYIIASKAIFNFQTISLIGYSLGCNVVKHCLKEIARLTLIIPELSNLIRDVVLIGGACSIRNKPGCDWESIFTNCTGRVINVYSDSDASLRSSYKEFIGGRPIGLEPLMLVNESKKCIVENYQYDEMRLNHTQYPDYLDKILEKLKIFY